jgi:carbamoyltransferase
MDLAASLQKLLEETVLTLLDRLHRETGQYNLCLAGGVALNSVMNGVILERSPFKKLYVQPAASDGGAALGAAYYIEHAILNRPRVEVMTRAYTGPEFSDAECRAALDAYQLSYVRCSSVEAQVAELIAKGALVGWFQGRMELGPRALGNRSILADPRRPEMREILNEKVKQREWFRPFAPTVLQEACGEFFEFDYPSPFMLLVYRVRPEKRHLIPAVTHVDGTARVQTVGQEDNPRYYALIAEFKRLTGIPIVLNTSFNGKGEPIVCTPQDAIECYLRTGLDCLVLGEYLVEKRKN